MDQLTASARPKTPSTSSSSGTSSPLPGKTQAAAAASQVVGAEPHSPASLRLKLRILPYLLKSNTVANDFPICIQVAKNMQKIMYM